MGFEDRTEPTPPAIEDLVAYARSMRGPVQFLSFIRWQDGALNPSRPSGARDPSPEALAAYQRWRALSDPIILQCGGKLSTMYRRAVTLVEPQLDWDVLAISSYDDVKNLITVMHRMEILDALPHRRLSMAWCSVVLCESYSY